MSFPQPSEANSYLVEHINLLRYSYKKYVGQDLIEFEPGFVSPDSDEVAVAQAIYHAPFVVVSHNTAADPIFNYGNETALDLFEMTWEEFTALHSRQSAELPNREERARLLQAVSTQGFIQNYSGKRISKSSKKFFIEQATVWNLVDNTGNYCGQAATFSHWKYL